ncbi:MAG: MATE family efflux transporter [Clostridia bacterium]|nr:MATE family efflux transporter [Clostridia bacterium]
MRILKNDSIHKRILRYSAFATATLLASSAVNLTDAYFVSKLGQSATAAVGVAFAAQFLIQAIGFTLGMGGGSLFSRALGGNDREKCDRISAQAILQALLIGSVIAIAGNIFLDPLLDLLGATAGIYDPSRIYLRFLLYAAPFICLSLVISQLLRAAGNAALSTVGFVSGGAVNLILTPLFLFIFDMGIAGAGLALLIGYVFATCLLFGLTFCKSSKVSPIKKLVNPFGADAFRLLWTGLPSFCRHGFSGFATLLLNNTVSAYGDHAIAAVTVVSRISLLALSFCTGIGQGMIPVAGYHYGARDMDSVRKSYRFALILSSAFMLILSIPIFLLAPQLVSLFREEPEIVSIGAAALRAQSTVYVLHGTITATTMLLQVVGRSASSTVLASARQGIFFFPILLLFPTYFRYAQPIADALTFLLTVYFIMIMRRLTPSKKERRHPK